MIGRGAMGNPALFKQVNDYLETGKYEEITPFEKLEAFFRYLGYAKNYNIKFASIRVQAMQFTKGLERGGELRLRIGQAKDEEELKKAINGYKNQKL
jgi:tRNA-dihydrouridine synthase B